jgi:hypothetical protein
MMIVNIPSLGSRPAAVERKLALPASLDDEPSECLGVRPIVEAGPQACQLEVIDVRRIANVRDSSR